MHEHKSEHMYSGACGSPGAEVIRAVSNWMSVLGNKIGSSARELNAHNR